VKQTGAGIEIRERWNGAVICGALFKKYSFVREDLVVYGYSCSKNPLSA